jgi:hypothetical protein
MEDVQPQIWKVEVSRQQKRWALVGLLAWVFLAVAGAWTDWSGGRWSSGSLGMASVRMLQGLFIWQIGLGLDAKVLRVEQGMLEVTTKFRRPFLGPKLSMPIQQADLEWIGDMLVLQKPESGSGVRLGRAEGAKALADWLVTRGARAPVGG